jgi:arabinose-5-phosphate isomerase
MNEPRADLEIARKTLAAEGQAISALAGQLDDSFARAVEAVYRCSGKVILTGIGKAGVIAQKISGTLASTGTQSIFLHPVEALHGDLGRVQRCDVVLALSHSGETQEIQNLVDHLKGRGAMLIALTGNAESPLAKYSDIAVCYGRVEEACPLGLAPTVSTSCMLALGDAMALTVMTMRNFQPEDFAAFHPAGALGRRLMTVDEAMIARRDDRLQIESESLPLGDALAAGEKVSRRPGAMLLVDADGRLSGILTDADLRRAMIRRRGENLLSLPVRDLMIRNPKHVRLGTLASEALAIMNRHRIDELPVLDADGRPVGLIDVQDLLGIKTVGNGQD